MEDNGYDPFTTACKAVVLTIDTNPPNYENYPLSGWRELHPLPQPWQGCALLNELHPHNNIRT
jgi:hypothetical protein